MALVKIVFHEDRILGHRDNVDIADITDICIRDVERYCMRINGHLEIFLN